MRLKEGYVFLKDAQFYAFHGVMPQERKVGGYFRVSVRVGYPLEKAVVSDAVGDTLNYASLYALVEREMQQPSGLLEHVAGRIADAIVKTFPETLSIDLTLTKQNPPMGADCDGAGVEIRWEVKSEE